MDDSKIFMAVFLMLFCVCGIFAIDSFTELGTGLYSVLIDFAKIFLLIMTPLSFLMIFDAISAAVRGR